MGKIKNSATTMISHATLALRLRLEGASMWCSTRAVRTAARCIVAVCAALMDMGGAFLVVVAFHLGAVARGPHAVENILAVDAVIVGTLAPQSEAVLRRDGQTTVLTPAIDDPSAAQAAFFA